MLLSTLSTEFKKRREKFFHQAPGAALLLPAAPEVLRNPDVHYPFRQESHFYYLTGFEEPESFLVLTAQKKMALFVRRRDPEREMWEGERYGVEGARSVFGADLVYPIDELDAKLPELLHGADQVLCRLGQQEAMDRRILAILERVRVAAGRSGKSLLPLSDPNELIGEMRLYKGPEEIAHLRKACEVTSRAHRAAMGQTAVGMNEGEIEALIDYEFRRGGCARVGYGSIVASGKNAACLHYRANNEPVRSGDLILIDAGGEYGYYTSDVTRVFPVDAQFAPAQAELYDLVLESQKAAIALAKPGATLPQLHMRVNEVLVEGMLRLGFLKGDRAKLIQSGAHKRFYPHNTSHWLGMDVHDTGLYQRNGEARRLEPGMVFTIEPGFYIQPGDREIPERFASLGIRIEDNILITDSGCEVLTHDAPKERAEIEAIRSAARPF